LKITSGVQVRFSTPQGVSGFTSVGSISLKVILNEPAVSAHDTGQDYSPEHRDSPDDLTFSESVKNAGEETA